MNLSQFPSNLVHSMIRTTSALAIAAMIPLGPTDALAQLHENRDMYVLRCLEGDANLRIDDMPFKDYCPNIQHGSMNGPWYGDRESKWVETMTQKEWSRMAAKELACSKNEEDWVKAVNLIAVCNCNSKVTVDYLRSNRSYALSLMRVWAKCE